MQKVFGIGWAKTGTTTLGDCFKLLGYRHQGQELDLVEDLAVGDLSRIFSLAGERDTFEDWPWIVLYKELDNKFPGSRFILTIREPHRWIRSYRNMLERQGMASEELNKIRRILYGLPFPEVTEDQLLNRYNKHINDVQCYFADRSDDLLIVDWEKGDGWSELCSFLERDVPEIPFPHSNIGTYSDRKPRGVVSRVVDMMVGKIGRRRSR